METDASAPRPPAETRFSRWAGPALVALAAVAMAAWTWRAWPDPLIDFGQQLYVSWRLAEGDALYRDVAYLYGPALALASTRRSSASSARA